MIRTFGRFLLLLLLCVMFVYAPEILSSVSAPYSLSAPQRVLLRIALCCDDEAVVSSLYKTLNAYQKAYPYVHLRVTRVDEAQLASMLPPHPDVFLAPHSLASMIPVSTLADTAGLPETSPQPLLCAVSAESGVRETAVGFTAYLYEAMSPQNEPADF